MDDLEDFFNDLNEIREDQNTNIKLFVGESPYKDNQNIEDLEGYPFKQVAFFRKNDSSHKSLTGILHVIVGESNTKALYRLLKKNKIPQSVLVQFLEKKYSMFFVNLFKVGNLTTKNTNFSQINQFFANNIENGRIVDVLIIGSKGKAYFPGFINNNGGKILATNHPQIGDRDKWSDFTFLGDEKWHSSEMIKEYFSLVN